MQSEYKVTTGFDPATVDVRDVIEGLKSRMLDLLNADGANPLDYTFRIIDHTKSYPPRNEADLTAHKRDS